ncbi:MAG TPA: site-specific integrase [Bryobacteraceae bacterium]|nr:site-specific integrase [Bryobacteraceae bacterium]
MPKTTTTLTEITLRTVRPPAHGQITIWDALPNFGVRVSQGGAKTFVVLLGRNGNRHTIGRYPIISLQEARSEARRLLAERTLGQHQPQSITFERALPIFIASQYQGKRDRSRKETERLLKRHFLPKFRGDRVSNISTERLSLILNSLEDTPSLQRHALMAGSTFLRWCVNNRYINHNPSQGLKFAKGKSRTRTLTNEEISSVWRATRERTNFNLIVRLCLLIGQRRGEVGGLRAEYIDWQNQTITFPPEAVKNNREHTIPFGKLAAAILITLPKEGYLFPGNHGAECFNGYSKCKRALDKKCKIEHWTLHDLRRTFATNLAGKGTAPHIVERLLNHVTGIISGVASVYNKYSYMNEMREAVAAWEDQLKRLSGSVRRVA